MIRGWFGFCVLLLLYGLVGEPEYERVDSTAYTEQVMEESRLAALNEERQARWAHHMEWGDQVLAMGDNK